VDAFLGVLGILAIKAMKSSPEDINDLLRELARQVYTTLGHME
jgi:hypothetical protein